MRRPRCVADLRAGAAPRGPRIATPPPPRCATRSTSYLWATGGAPRKRGELAGKLLEEFDASGSARARRGALSAAGGRERSLEALDVRFARRIETTRGAARDGTPYRLRQRRRAPRSCQRHHDRPRVARAAYRRCRQPGGAVATATCRARCASTAAVGARAARPRDSPSPVGA